ncbi:hypothetical protein [Novosphingobium terrae]|uniref:hypothetical protein n=1 Tax=Novosphingobium terrae TaxID=2726189 RepID=UPI00197DD135|nr:hypothetical protein [Novosphingobium terrae]
MDDEACKAVGSVLAIIGDLLEKNGICTMMQLANRIGNMAMVTESAGPQFETRAGYLAIMAFCVKAAAEGPSGASGQDN